MRHGKQDWSSRDMPSERPLNAQPKWEFVANLGDRNPLDYGGYFVYKDSTGVYEDEAELILPEDEGDKVEVRRINLERYKRVEGYLVPIRYDPTWPRALRDYDAWFHRELAGAADSIGAASIELEMAFTSLDPLIRAEAYRTVGDYVGWDNFDSYPRIFTQAQLKKRYRKELRKIKEQP